MYLEYIELCLLLCAADILYEILHTMFKTIFFCDKVEQKNPLFKPWKTLRSSKVVLENITFSIQYENILNNPTRIERPEAIY